MAAFYPFSPHRRESFAASSTTPTTPIPRQPQRFVVVDVDVAADVVVDVVVAEQLFRRATEAHACSGTMEDREARRFYAIARGSALECAAIVDAFQALQFVLAAEADRAHELLERILSMLTKMARVGE